VFSRILTCLKGWGSSEWFFVVLSADNTLTLMLYQIKGWIF